jgi:gliding motility-associated-like protein
MRKQYTCFICLFLIFNTLLDAKIEGQTLKDIKIKIDTVSSSCSSLVLNFSAYNIPADIINFSMVFDDGETRIASHKTTDASSQLICSKTFTKHDFYTVYLLVSNNISENPDTISKNFDFKPDPFFRWNFESENNGKYTISFDGYKNGTNYLYYWTLAGDTISNSEDFQYTFNKAGTYTVQLKVSDGTCADSSSQIIRAIPNELPDSILAKGKLTGIFPNVFTPNGDGNHDEFYIPTNGKDIYTLEVYSLGGMLIYKSTSPTILWDGRTVSGEEAKAGQYFYIIRQGNKLVHKEFLALFR